MPIHQTQLPLLRDRREQQYALHPRKRLANTLPHACSKREVSQLRAPRLGLGRKALRIETQRIREKTLIAVRNELADQYRCLRRQKEFAQPKVSARVAPHVPRRRI